MTRPVWLVCFLATAGVADVAAQCPDGSPLPCARATPRAPAPNSVAVLYLDNLSRDTADAYLADGLTEEIIIRLGQVQRLAVKSRFEVQRFRGRTPVLDPPALGRSLNAAYLVSGSVQRAGDQVRLRVALVRAATRAQVWGDVFDRTNSNLLTVESDIAQAVAAAITGQLLPEERTRLARPVTTDPVAYEEYLRGVQANRSFDEASIRSALAHFDRAIERDSGFAAAYAGRAISWTLLADAYVSPRAAYERALDDARHGIARDSTQALAYALLANAILALDLNAREAERLAHRAVRLDPRGALEGWALGGLLFAAGRVKESIDAAARAWQSDSLDPTIASWYAELLIRGHQLDSAAALLPRLRAFMSPVDVDPLEGFLLAARGDLRGAEHLLGWRYYGGKFAGTYVRAQMARGDTVAARATVDSMLSARTAGYYNAMALAGAFAALGDIDRGMDWLQLAFDERTIWLIYVRTDDALAPLRVDPRYAALDRQLRY